MLGALNFIVTILKMRTPGMGVHQMPVFCWSMLATSAITLLGTPVLASALILLSFDLLAGTTFLTQLVVEIQSYTSTCSGSTPTQRFTL
jgi:cytochrome c oxidase subunit 1